MAWSFSARGPKEQCVAMLEESKAPDDPEGAYQYENMRDVVKDELDRYADGSSGMSISASGHATSDGGDDRMFSIFISGKAAPKRAVPPRASKPTEPPAKR